MHLSSFLHKILLSLHSLSSSPTCRLLCHFFHYCVKDCHNHSVLVWWLAWRLRAASTSSGDLRPCVSQNGAWCLVTFSILLQNYASVLTFSLMHKIHDVCGTSCRRCSREEGKARSMAQLRLGPQCTSCVHTHKPYVWRSGCMHFWKSLLYEYIWK